MHTNRRKRAPMSIMYAYRLCQRPTHLNGERKMILTSGWGVIEWVAYLRLLILLLYSPTSFEVNGEGGLYTLHKPSQTNSGGIT